MRIILASKSPRRKEILENLGVEFEIIVADTDENCDIKVPSDLVMTLAEKKGRAVKDGFSGNELKDTLIIACDTLVYANGEFLGKPKNHDDAYRMLSMLSDNAHSVVSGIYTCFEGQEATAYCSTNVYFDKMSNEEIEDYINSGEPCDKAGAYAIQGKASAYISKIEGDYFNVVGLPVNTLCKLLKDEFSINLTKL